MIVSVGLHKRKEICDVFFQCRYTLLEEEKLSQAVILRKSMFTKTVKTCSRMFSVQIPQNHRMVGRDLKDQV